MEKVFNICGYNLNASEISTAENERGQYGISVYIIHGIPCSLWEEIMPYGTIREKEYRDVNEIWGAFIRNNQSNLNSFISKISSLSGYNFHVANRHSLPPSIYNYLSMRGFDWYENGHDTEIDLVLYGNNK